MMASSKQRLFPLEDSARVAHDQRRATLFPVVQQNVSPVYLHYLHFCSMSFAVNTPGRGSDAFAGQKDLRYGNKFH